MIRSSGGDDAGFALVAGRSKDNRLVQILISNFQIAAKYLGGPRNNWDTTLPERRTLQYSNNAAYDATVTLPASGRYQVKRYRISDSSSFALLDQRVETGPNIHVQAALPPPGDRPQRSRCQCASDQLGLEAETQKIGDFRCDLRLALIVASNQALGEPAAGAAQEQEQAIAVHIAHRAFMMRLAAQRPVGLHQLSAALGREDLLRFAQRIVARRGAQRLDVVALMGD